MLTIEVVLRIVALVLFVVAAVGIPSPRINVTAAGLAVWVLSLLV